MDYCVGIDEAGRGPLAGPVVAAAVILPQHHRIKGLTDSKLLTPKARESLAEIIYQKAVAVGVGICSVEEIDRLNILRATLLAMQKAVSELKIQPTLALVDGNQPPDLPCITRTIVGGDESEPCISAASIIAKVTRDALMVEADLLFPGYGFAKHKGYGTPEHQAMLTQLGPCPLHRRSFEPVRRALL